MLMLLTGLATLAGGILCRGFYTLGENEVAVVVEYEPVELFGQLLNELARGCLLYTSDAADE